MSATRLLDVGRKMRLAFGLEWHIPRGDIDFRKERKNQHRLLKASHEVVLRQENTRMMIGVASGLKRSQSAMSAAVLLGAVEPKGVVALAVKIDEEFYGLCVSRDGKPLVGFDVVMREDSTNRKLEELARFFPDGNYRVFCSADCIEKFPESEPYNVKKLFDADVIKTARLVPTTLPLKLITLSGVILVSFFGGVYGWMWWQQEQALERARALMPAQQAQPVDPNVIYHNELPNQLLMAGARVDLLPHLLNEVKGINLSHRGWRLSTVECSTENCSTKWVIDGGNYEDLNANPIPLLTNVSYSQDFTSVTGDLSLTKVNGLHGVSESQLLKQQDFLVKTGTIVQKLQRTNAATFTIKDPQPYGLPQGVAPESIAKLVRVGAWEYNSNLSSAMIPNEFPHGFTLDKISISVPASPNLEAVKVKIEGKYYVQ